MPYVPLPVARQPGVRDRRFVFVGAVALAALAGYINVIMLGVIHIPVSHVTGAVAWISTDLVLGDTVDLLPATVVALSFLVGAFLSGLIIDARRPTPGRRYGIVMMIEGLFLALATILLLRGELLFGVTLAAGACGMQNAMASSYYGLVIRTTHMTGIVTDIGVMLALWVRHRRIRAWKLGLLGGILGGFLGGGLAGTMAFRSAGIDALGAAAAAAIIAGGTYFGWRHRIESTKKPPQRSVAGASST